MCHAFTACVRKNAFQANNKQNEIIIFIGFSSRIRSSSIWSTNTPIDLILTVFSFVAILNPFRFSQSQLRSIRMKIIIDTLESMFSIVCGSTFFSILCIIARLFLYFNFSSNPFSVRQRNKIKMKKKVHFIKKRRKKTSNM